MSKLNINFNGSDYSIDESVLASASADLKFHLSSVMNGDGATIDFDGVTYNVDSTKLSNATNDFVAHIDTIAGNGAKITIGGVEYSVDSTKLSGATSGLEDTMSTLSGGDAAETHTITFDNGYEASNIFVNGELITELEMGETYTFNTSGSIVIDYPEDDSEMQAYIAELDKHGVYVIGVGTGIIDEYITVDGEAVVPQCITTDYDMEIYTISGTLASDVLGFVPYTDNGYWGWYPLEQIQ